MRRCIASQLLVAKAPETPRPSYSGRQNSQKVEYGPVPRKKYVGSLDVGRRYRVYQSTVDFIGLYTIRGRLLASCPGDRDDPEITFAFDA